MKDGKIDYLIEKIEQLEQRINQMNTTPIVHSNRLSNSENKMSDKLLSRQILFEKVKILYPGLMVTIAKRQDGGGLLLINKHNNQSYRVKCFYSRNYSSSRIFGWFSIRKTDLFDTPYDFYAMSLDFNQKNHVFIFSQKQMLSLINDKQSLRDNNSNNQVDRLEHFYIENNKGIFYETREVDKNLDEYREIVEGGINISYAYQNYDIFHETIEGIYEVSNKPFITNDLTVIKNRVYEVLNSQFMIPLQRKDFYYTGSLYQYIEINFKDHKVSELELDIDNIKSVVLHIRAHSNTPLNDINNIFVEINNKFKTQVFMGLSIDDSLDVQIQVFLLRKKEVI